MSSEARYVYARRFALPSWLLLGVILVLGLIWRIAYVRAQSFPNDISSFEGWAIALVAHGPTGFYTSTSFIDYREAAQCSSHNASPAFGWW